MGEGDGYPSGVRGRAPPSCSDDSRQPAAASRQQPAGSRQPAAASRQPGTRSRSRASRQLEQLIACTKAFLLEDRVLQLLGLRQILASRQGFYLSIESSMLSHEFIDGLRSNHLCHLRLQHAFRQHGRTSTTPHELRPSESSSFAPPRPAGVRLAHRGPAPERAGARPIPRSEIPTIAFGAERTTVFGPPRASLDSPLCRAPSI